MEQTSATQVSTIESDKIIDLPEHFLRWQSEARVNLFSQMLSSGPAIEWQSAHLPVMATLGSGKYPINLACKGFGPLPRPQALRSTTELFHRAAENGKGSIDLRVRAAQEFYGDHLKFDPQVLGGLEIFEGRTLQNVEGHAPVTLLFTEGAPRFKSYQINGHMTMERPDDDRYEFLVAARQLFAREAFHIPQTRYPVAYLFHPEEFLDKTPISRG